MVAGVNGVSRVTGVGSGQSVMPFCCDSSTRWNGDNILRNGLLERVFDTVADEAVRGHIHDGLNK